MKGAMMKFGQLLGFIVEGLPDEAQAALATLQSDAPPMSAEAAEQVVRAEFGVSPWRLFAEWSPEPVAAASIGQVHRATDHQGRPIAVKVQYPGVGDALEADLANTETLYRMASAFALKGLDTKGLVDELRARMIEELDYRREFANQHEFANYFRGHPFIRVPDVLSATSGRTVITSEWVDGVGFDTFASRATATARQHAGEVIWRFAQHAVHYCSAFNGDPHPGNYRFALDGNVSFIDFGLVKRWERGEWQRLLPTLHAIVEHRDPESLVAAMVTSGFLRDDHGLHPQLVFDYVSTPYTPYLTDEFGFSREFMRTAVATIADVRGPHSAVISALNMPPSFVILDRVVWGVNAILGKLEARGPWRLMLLEYLAGGPPTTPLGELERQWLSTRG
jgi:predicted unusual protein kinase regulating ubiquinone biosynthesis (AarF/ABC1/UbiB family)